MVVIGEGRVQGHIPTVDAVMGKGVQGHHCGCYFGGQGIFRLWIVWRWRVQGHIPTVGVIGGGYKSIAMNVTGGEGGTWHIPIVGVIGRGYRGIAVDVISGAGHIPDVDFLEGTGAYSHCGCFWRKGVQAHIPMFF